MKSRQLAVVLLALAVCSAFTFGCKQGPWETFTSEAGKFNIKFPGKPKITTKTQDLGSGITLTTTDHIVDPILGRFGAKYDVMVMDFSSPNMAQLNFDQNKMIDSAKEGIVNEGGKILAERTVESSGNSGWEFEVTSDQKSLDSTMRLYVKGYRVYMLEVARRKGNNVSEETQKFFESFEIVD